MNDQAASTRSKYASSVFFHAGRCSPPAARSAAAPKRRAGVTADPAVAADMAAISLRNALRSRGIFRSLGMRGDDQASTAFGVRQWCTIGRPEPAVCPAFLDLRRVLLLTAAQGFTRRRHSAPRRSGPAGQAGNVPSPVFLTTRPVNPDCPSASQAVLVGPESAVVMRTSSSHHRAESALCATLLPLRAVPTRSPERDVRDVSLPIRLEVTSRGGRIRSAERSAGRCCC